MPESEQVETSTSVQDPAQNLTNTWEVYVDGLSNAEGSGARIVIVSPEGVTIEHALHLEFPVTNNEAEYKALIMELGVAKELRVQDLRVYSDP